jgi:hypothetical protein
MRRTIEYAQKGIYVLWLLQWTPALDGRRYAPTLWEKWIHALYFGQVYYWVEGLTVASYRFDPYFKTIQKTSWYSNDGEKRTAVAGNDAVEPPINQIGSFSLTRRSPITSSPLTVYYTVSGSATM